MIGMTAPQSGAVFPFPTFRWVWGENAQGELGNFSNQDSNRPITTSLGLPAGVSLTRLSGGNNAPLSGAHTLALDRNGNVWGWGHNPFGQVGNGETSSVPVFGPAKVCATAPALPCTEFLSNVTAIAAGGRHSLAVDIHSNVWAWGDNTLSQLGSNVGTRSALPVRNNALFAQLHQLPGPPSVKSVAAGAVHSLALDSRGVVWAWGNNSFGQLGLGTSSSTELFALALDTFPAGTVITAIATGTYHSLALDNAGNVWAWGQNTNGQLGISSFDMSRNVPEKLIHFPPNTRIIAIAGGGGHSLALDSGGNVWAFGANMIGQLGNGQNIDQHGPTLTTFPAGTPRIVAIAAGGSHSLALDANHNVWAWGNNGNGQLGNQAPGVPSNVPVRANFPEGTNVTTIAAGHNHSLALESEGFKFELEGVLEFEPFASQVRLLPQAFDPDKTLNVETTSTDLTPSGSKLLVTNKLTDPAGNKLVLTLVQEKIGSDAVSLEVVSMQYNDGAVITPPDNQNEIHWNTDATGKVTMLQQHVRIELPRGMTNIKVHYVEGKNQTEINVTAPGGRPQRFTHSGLVTVQMSTINGTLSFSDGIHSWP
jgi:alpha-tubulin suppressor-like RCC1 family protein